MSREFGDRSITPEILGALIDQGYSADRVSVGHSYAVVDALQEIPRRETDEELVRNGVDLGRTDDAIKWPAVKALRDEHGYLLSDAAFIAKEGVPVDYVDGLFIALGRRPGVYEVLDAHRYELSASQFVEWQPTQLSCRDVRSLLDADPPLTVDRYLAFASLGLNARDVPEVQREWAPEDPSDWMATLSCSYETAREWRIRLADLALAKQWVDEGFSPAEHDEVRKAELSIDVLIDWRRAGVTGIDAVLQHRLHWDASECSVWQRELELDPTAALEWKATDLALNECRGWSALPISPEQAMEFARFELSVDDAAGFIESGVSNPSDVRALVNRRVSPDRLAEWISAGASNADAVLRLEELSLTPTSFTDWLTLLGSISEVMRWVEAGADIGVSRSVLSVLPVADRSALDWTLAEVGDLDRIELIRGGVSPEDAVAFMDLGLQSAEKVIDAAERWSPSDARAWMEQLDCDCDTALRWFSVSDDVEMCREVDSPEQLLRWRDLDVHNTTDFGLLRTRGFSLVEAERWVGAGMPNAMVASEFFSRDMSLESSLTWFEAGYSGEDAFSLAREGLDVERARDWRRLIEVASPATEVTVDEILHCVAHWETVEDARQWCEALRLGPRDAWSWRQEFSDIKDAQRWRSWADLDTAALWSAHRWNGEEFWECDRAADWATSGVADPDVASTWRKKNFAPDDAVTWLTCKVDADFAQECESQGLDHGQFQRLASEHPAWDPDQIAWKWSLVRAGLECDNEDGVPGIHLEKGRPSDALTRLAEVIEMALENGVDRFIVAHGARNLRLDLLEFVDDPVFVRGAGRVALDYVMDDPELCVRSVEHDDAGRSTVVLKHLTKRPQFFSAGKSEQELAA